MFSHGFKKKKEGEIDMSSFLSLKGTQETLSARNPETFLFPVSDIFFFTSERGKKNALRSLNNQSSHLWPNIFP